MAFLEGKVDNNSNVSGWKNYRNIFFGFVVGAVFYLTYYFLTRSFYNYFVFWGDLGMLGRLIAPLVYVLIPSAVVFIIFRFLKKSINFRKGLVSSLIFPFLFLLFVFTLFFFGFTNDYYYQKAILERNSEYCYDIEVSSMSQSCLRDTSFVIADYYFQKALSSGDKSYCDKMNMVDHIVSKCYFQVDSGEMRPLGLCEGSDSCRKNLDDGYYYMMAIENLDSNFCRLVSSSKKKYNCYNNLGMIE